MKTLIAIAIICLLIGFTVGYGVGYTAALNWGIGKAVYFLNLNNVTLDIREKEILQGIQYYKNKIDDTYKE